ncbi:MAG TPA: NAD-dependent epimerase/dehydratase family protein, partial [Opitutus sp.]|nr:NAD-dependent epimerase/dehydratase family protein [Opitutus sp.]
MSDERFTSASNLPAAAADAFAWHERPGALERLCPPWESLAVARSAGGLRDGARVHVRQRVGPFSIPWEVEHRDYVEGVQFRDVQLSGPFAKWEHLHRFDVLGASESRLTDEIAYRLPAGRLGRALAGRRLRAELQRMFRWRHETTRADLAFAARYAPVRPRRIVVAGGSGLIGRALVPFLRTQGHQVSRLVRRRAAEPDEISWDPSKRNLDAAHLEGVDAIVNLSGENVAAGRWTARRRESILRSRIEAAET